MSARDYDEAIVHKALELAATIGIRPAGRQLEIPEKTIRNWTRNDAYAPRWAELRRINAPKWRERAALSMEELVDSYSEIEAKAVTKALEALEELEPRDVANFLRSVAVAKGVTADHVGKLRGQPTEIHEHRVDVPQLEQAITALLTKAQAHVDATAEELPALPPADVQVVPEDESPDDLVSPATPLPPAPAGHPSE